VPLGCPLSDVEALWPAADTPALDLALGDEGQPAQVRQFQLPGGRWVRAWSRDGVLVELDLDGPVALDPNELGEPEARLTAHFGFAAYPEGERVFARRGLIVGVSPDEGVVLYAAVFPPTSVDEYVRWLRIDRVQRPTPR
jgi:hypothetical protein